MMWAPIKKGQVSKVSRSTRARVWRAGVGGRFSSGGQVAGLGPVHPHRQNTSRRRATMTAKTMTAVFSLSMARIGPKCSKPGPEPPVASLESGLARLQPPCYTGEHDEPQAARGLLRYGRSHPPSVGHGALPALPGDAEAARVASAGRAACSGAREAFVGRA